MDLGVLQLVDFEGHEQRFHEILENARTYMNTKVRGVMDPAIVTMCKNENENCTLWTMLGECEANPECTWMSLTNDETFFFFSFDFLPVSTYILTESLYRFETTLCSRL